MNHLKRYFLSQTNFGYKMLLTTWIPVLKPHENKRCFAWDRICNRYKWNRQFICCKVFTLKCSPLNICLRNEVYWTILLNDRRGEHYNKCVGLLSVPTEALVSVATISAEYYKHFSSHLGLWFPDQIRKRDKNKSLF